MKKYFPYPANDGKHKYYIITNDNKKIILELLAFLILQFIKMKQGDKDIDRHKKNESKFWNKSGIDTASFWARFLLWEKPAIKESYEYIKRRFNL